MEEWCNLANVYRDWKKTYTPRALSPKFRYAKSEDERILEETKPKRQTTTATPKSYFSDEDLASVRASLTSNKK